VLTKFKLNDETIRLNLLEGWRARKRQRGLLRQVNDLSTPLDGVDDMEAWVLLALDHRRTQQQVEQWTRYRHFDFQESDLGPRVLYTIKVSYDYSV